MLKRIPVSVLMFFNMLIIFVAIPIAFAVSINRTFFPVVYGAQPLGLVTLRESDTTFISATVDSASSRVYVAFIDRANGNRAHDTELIGNTLHEMTLPALSNQELRPSFVTPDSNKDAAVCQFVLNGVVWFFFTSRDACVNPEDCAGTPFKLKLLRFIPPTAHE